MPAINGIHILAAVLLFLFSSVFMYIFWYIIFGRKQRKKGESSHEEPKHDNETTQKGKWGVDKNAYCYPKINDVMGFEFVKVIKVNQETASSEKKPEAQPTWEGSRGIGGLTAVSSTEARQEREEDEPYPETDTGRRPAKARRQHAEDNDSPDESDITQIPFTEEEMNALSFFSSEWPSRGEYDSIPDDDAMDYLLDKNSDMVEKPDMNQEQLKTAKEIEELQRIYHETEKRDYGQQIDDLLDDDIGEAGDEDVDFENDHGQIEADDMPDAN